MKIYDFSPLTGEYIGSSNTNGTTTPRFATTEKPPKQKAGQALVFENGEWLYKIDNRERSYWTELGERVTIYDIGVEIPKGALERKPDLRTLNEVKRAAIEVVATSHAEFLRSLTGDATIEERDTWQTKAIAAEAIKRGDATESQSAMIDIEAELAGETQAELVSTILTKYTVYHSLIGLATGMKRKTEAAIEVAKTKEEVDAILKTAREEAEAKAAEWIAKASAA